MPKVNKEMVAVYAAVVDTKGNVLRRVKLCHKHMLYPYVRNIHSRRKRDPSRTHFIRFRNRHYAAEYRLLDEWGLDLSGWTVEIPDVKEGVHQKLWGRKYKTSLAVDPDTMEQVKELAKRDNIPVMEMFRQLIEWGLEAAEDDARFASYAKANQGAGAGAILRPN